MTLSQARQFFRQTPNCQTALAYMDAAIEEWEGLDPDGCSHSCMLFKCLQEIRNWLTIETQT